MSELRQAVPLPIPDSTELRFLPEGPYPLDEGPAGEGRFSWVAIQHGADVGHGSLNLFDLGRRENLSHPLPGRPGFAFPCQSPGKFVIGLERSLGIFDSNQDAWQPFCDGVDHDVTNTIINDGLIYEDNLIFGTKDLEFKTKKAGLYLWRGRDRRLIRLRDDQICSNGKAIQVAADGGLHLIDIDSPTRQVVRYRLDLDAGTLGEREVLLDLTSDPAVPDGAILTPDGAGIVVSMFLPQAAEQGETRWYDLASGELRCRWVTPGSPQNTCPALVRHEGKLVLVITTAVENMTPEDQASCANAGRLFLGAVDFPDSGEALGPRFPDSVLA